MVVWSQDLQSNKFIKITIPASAQVDAVGGYGRYSLGSLWKLGAIDNKNGTLVSDSLEEALGISIPWYVDVSPGRWLPRTNMPLPLLLSWIWRMRSVKSDRMTEVAITPQAALAVRICRMEPARRLWIRPGSMHFWVRCLKTEAIRRERCPSRSTTRRICLQ